MSQSLGRGLASLIPQKKYSSPVSASAQSLAPQAAVPDGERILKISLGRIKPNPLQPRTEFKEEELNDLVESIKEHGLLQPIVVGRCGDNYELIAGERRLRAAKLAGLTEISAIVRDGASLECQKLELALVENIQRQNLNPVEEARAYQKLMETYRLTQEQAAKRMGKSRSVLANTIRILSLPEKIQKAIISGDISKTHARVLAGLKTEKEQMDFLKRILSDHYTTNAAEEAVQKVSVKQHSRRLNADPVLAEKEECLREKLSTKVRIKKTGQIGRIVIEFYSEEELGEIVKKIIE